MDRSHWNWHAGWLNGTDSCWNDQYYGVVAPNVDVHTYDFVFKLDDDLNPVPVYTGIEVDERSLILELTEDDFEKERHPEHLRIHPEPPSRTSPAKKRRSLTGTPISCTSTRIPTPTSGGDSPKLSNSSTPGTPPPASDKCASTPHALTPKKSPVSSASGNHASSTRGPPSVNMNNQLQQLKRKMHDLKMKQEAAAKAKMRDSAAVAAPHAKAKSDATVPYKTPCTTPKVKVNDEVKVSDMTPYTTPHSQAKKSTLHLSPKESTPRSTDSDSVKFVPLPALVVPDTPELQPTMTKKKESKIPLIYLTSPRMAPANAPSNNTYPKKCASPGGVQYGANWSTSAPLKTRQNGGRNKDSKGKALDVTSVSSNSSSDDDSGSENESSGSSSNSSSSSSSSSSADEAPPRCPKQHRLKAFLTPDNGWWCSGCDKELTKRVEMHGCRSCDYDLCARCARPGQKSSLKDRRRSRNARSKRRVIKKTDKRSRANRDSSRRRRRKKQEQKNCKRHERRQERHLKKESDEQQRMEKEMEAARRERQERRRMEKEKTQKEREKKEKEKGEEKEMQKEREKKQKEREKKQKESQEEEDRKRQVEKERKRQEEKERKRRIREQQEEDEMLLLQKLDPAERQNEYRGRGKVRYNRAPDSSTGDDAQTSFDYFSGARIKAKKRTREDSSGNHTPQSRHREHPKLAPREPRGGLFGQFRQIIRAAGQQNALPLKMEENPRRFFVNGIRSGYRS
eukprot:GEMP01007565.1.p1 GENE.GEMP01007565.1~~GEMP01007565.1.p1  ORF type:complete len:737 (+),score=185.16 GEMP01007565.1:57-2267(+)